MKLKSLIVILVALPVLTKAQLGEIKNKFTKADTLRGSLNENRDWWDVLRYDIEVKPDFDSKSIVGKTRIVYKTSFDKEKYEKVRKNIPEFFKLQIDLQDPLVLDSATMDFPMRKVTSPPTVTIPFLQTEKLKIEISQIGYIIYVDANRAMSYPNFWNDTITIYYHGKPKEALRPPWDGGWIWRNDSLGRPWVSVAVQGLGASAWFPCKDHQSDEPDNGASLTVIVPDSLVAVANGKNNRTIKQSNNQTAYTWEVKNPINSYLIIPYTGKYVNFTDTLNGENGKLDLSYWVLDYNLEKAKKQFQQVKPMLRCFEHWFGPYPFYEDDYKLVDAPHLGMEHQSAIAYGNRYLNGYLGRDRSGTGWGSKWDFIIIHESGHEWFANNITSKDIADMWIHESFTNYSETLYTEWLFGKNAGNEYNYGLRRNIQNDAPIIGAYGVNKEGSGDMYDKGGNMIHTIRHVINNDEKFRQILRGLNKTFWHQTVTSKQIEDYINDQSGINFQKTFDQYLRTTQIPQLEFYIDKSRMIALYRWTNCIKDFDLPLVINNKRIPVTTKWNNIKLSINDISGWNPVTIEKDYYISAKQLQAKPKR